MRVFIILLTAVLMAACTPEPSSYPPEIDGQGTPETLISYAASEWEPSWGLKLSGGNRIEFRQLDPVSGADFITDSYTILEKTARTNGWAVTGTGAKGTLSFTTLDVRAEGGCSHSATGEIHRDRVTVSSPLRKWQGCGGPTL